MSNTSCALPLIEGHRNLSFSSPVSPVNRFRLNFLSILFLLFCQLTDSVSISSFEFLSARGSWFRVSPVVSRLLCVPAGVNFTRKGLLVSDGREGGVVSYERFCLPLRVRCDEVKLLPVGDPTDPSGGRRGMANCSQQCPLQVLTIAN